MGEHRYRSGTARKAEESGAWGSKPRDDPATDAKKCVIVEVRHASHSASSSVFNLDMGQPYRAM